MAIEGFEDIEGWKLGRELAAHVHQLARDTGLKNDFSLNDQMSRSSGSIMDNIAEGFDAGANPEFIRFLCYAKRSCTERQSQFYRTLDHGYCDQQRFDQLYELASHAKSKFGGFIAYLKKSSKPTTLNPEP